MQKCQQYFRRVVATRQLHTSFQTLNKLYFEHENESNYAVLTRADVPTLSKRPSLDHVWKNIPYCRLTFRHLSNTQLLDAFYRTATYCRDSNIDISSTEFDSIIDEVVDRRSSLSPEEILIIFRALELCPNTPSKYSRNFHDLWSAFEDTLIKDMFSLKGEEKLELSDAFYRLRLGNSKFPRKALLRIGNSTENLKKPQLLHLAFLINATRKPLESMIEIEKNLLKRNNYAQYNIEELGIIAISFFKTESFIKNPMLIKLFYEKLIENIGHANEITVVNILKVLRYSSRIPEEELIKSLLDAITPHIHRFSLISYIHIILLGSGIQQCHEESLKIIVNRFVVDIKRARMKDIERLLFVIGLYDFTTFHEEARQFCELVINEFEPRVKEIAKYPKTLPQCLAYLILNDVPVPPGLISCCLNPEILDQTYGKNHIHYGREILMIDSYIEMYHQDNYDGYRLNKKYKDHLCRITVDYLPPLTGQKKLSKADTQLVEVYKALQPLYPYAKMTYPLPHFQRPDIVLAVDKESGESIDISANLPGIGSTILTRDVLLKDLAVNENFLSVAVVIGGWNLYIRHTDKPTGLLKYKVRQLEHVGYKVIVVHWEDWPKSSDQQVMYMKKAINELLKMP